MDMKNYIFIFIFLTIVYLVMTKSKSKGMQKASLTGSSRGKRIFTTEDATSSLLKISKEVGKERAQLLERILRHETGHFTSSQYKATGSAGMEEGDWKNLPAHSTLEFKDNNDGHIGKFIVWDSVYSFLNYLNDYIDRYGGAWARWNGTDSQRQTEYTKKVNSVTNKTII